MSNLVTSYGSSEPQITRAFGGVLTAQSQLAIHNEGDHYEIEGTANITRLPALPKGHVVSAVVTSGTPTLVHSASALIVQGSANYVLAVGDRVIFISAGDGVWRAFVDTVAGAPVTVASTTEVLTGTDAAKPATSGAIAALWIKGANVASAATISLGEGGYFHITGTIGITDIDFATAKDGRSAWLIFDGALTITHSGTTLNIAGGADWTTAANDRALVIQDAGDNVYLIPFRQSGYPLISAPGFRNVVRRNGGLEIWQRGAGGAASIAVGASTTVYTADGWYMFANANEASVVSQQAGITNGSQWCAKVLRNAGQTGTGLAIFGMPLDTDELYPLLGQFVRLSLTLKAGANWSPTSGAISIQFNIGTGTPVKQAVGFTGLAQAIIGSRNLTTVATRYEFSSPAIIPTTVRQAEITLVWSPVGTAGADDSFSIDDVQLEIVPDASQAASPFERLNFAEQLTLCRSHFVKSFLYGTAPVQNAGVNTGELSGIAGKTTTGAFWLPHRFRSPMRVAPTVTLFNPAVANAQARDETAAADCASTTTANLNAEGLEVTGTGNASSAVGNLIGVHFTADAGI